MDPDLLVFGIDRLRGRRSLVDEIVDVSATLVEDSDVPGNLEICRWSDVPAPPASLSDQLLTTLIEYSPIPLARL